MFWRIYCKLSDVSRFSVEQVSSSRNGVRSGYNDQSGTLTSQGRSAWSGAFPRVCGHLVTPGQIRRPVTPRLLFPEIGLLYTAHNKRTFFRKTRQCPHSHIHSGGGDMQGSADTGSFSPATFHVPSPQLDPVLTLPECRRADVSV